MPKMLHMSPIQPESDEPLTSDVLLTSSSRLSLSRRAVVNLTRAKEILYNRGMDIVQTEEIFRALLEEYEPKDIASTFLDNRVKKLDSSICSS